MRFSEGWIKMYRNIEHSWIGKDGIAFAIYFRLVGWANVSETEVLWGSEFIKVGIGQLVTSLEQIASSLSFDKEAVRRRLKLLEKQHAIRRLTSPYGTIITICNYVELYTNEKVESLDTNTKQHTDHVRIEELRSKKKNIIHNTGEGVPSQTAKAVSKVNTFISRYCELYKQKYGVNPVINGKASGIAKRVVKELGELRALALMEKYLLIEDSWFKTKSHDLQTFEGSLNRIEAHQEKISLVQEWINAGTK